MRFEVEHIFYYKNSSRDLFATAEMNWQTFSHQTHSTVSIVNRERERKKKRADVRIRFFVYVQSSSSYVWLMRAFHITNGTHSEWTRPHTKPETMCFIRFNGLFLLYFRPCHDILFRIGRFESSRVDMFCSTLFFFFFSRLHRLHKLSIQLAFYIIFECMQRIKFIFFLPPPPSSPALLTSSLFHCLRRHRCGCDCVCVGRHVSAFELPTIIMK